MMAIGKQINKHHGNQVIKFNVKQGSDVIVISGEHKGKRGKVLQMLRESQRVIVEGVNVCKKCIKKSQENPKGGIVEKEMPIHYSNVMLAPSEKVPAKKAIAKTVRKKKVS